MSKKAPMVEVGFIIVSHEGGEKLHRLIEALDREYDMPPIAIHHDFDQAPLDKGNFRNGIFWVENWVRTSWAKWSVVEGSLKAFRLLYEDTDADWFFLLSASDYPVRKGQSVRQELAIATVDAFIDARPIVSGMTGAAVLSGCANAKLSHFDLVANQKLKWRFYFSRQWWFPIIRFRPRLRIGKWTYRPPLESKHPFISGVTCFYGDHWFTANRKVVATLLERSLLNVELQHHYKNRTQPDESYYATLFANTKGLKICRDNRRFAEWNGGGAHPMILTSAQLPDIFKSNAFFARKFGDTPNLIEQVDAHLAAVS